MFFYPLDECYIQFLITNCYCHWIDNHKHLITWQLKSTTQLRQRIHGCMQVISDWLHYIRVMCIYPSPCEAKVTKQLWAQLIFNCHKIVVPCVLFRLSVYIVVIIGSVSILLYTTKSFVFRAFSQLWLSIGNLLFK